MEELIKIGYAEYYQLKPYISEMMYKGKNVWGFEDKSAVCIDGSVWEYIPEDMIYEYSHTKTQIIKGVEQELTKPIPTLFKG